MAEKEEKKEDKPKKLSPEEMRKQLVKDLRYVADVAEAIKRIRDSGIVEPHHDTEYKRMLSVVTTSVLGFPEKQIIPPYVPPAPVQPAPQTIPLQPYPRPPV